MHRIEPCPTRRETIQQIYAALDAPSWAAPNLDALADVLRDLAWREPGPIELAWQPSAELPKADLSAIHAVLTAAVASTAHTARPVRFRLLP